MFFGRKSRPSSVICFIFIFIFIHTILVVSAKKKKVVMEFHSTIVITLSNKATFIGLVLKKKPEVCIRS